MNWDNFTLDEFACSHCGENHIDPVTVDALQELRSDCRFVFIVSSGYRCPKHPNEIKKQAPGPHQSGKAVDIVLSHKPALILVRAIIQQDFFKGIGIAQRGDVDQRFIHMDWCSAESYRPRPHIWSY